MLKEERFQSEDKNREILSFKEELLIDKIEEHIEDMTLLENLHEICTKGGFRVLMDRVKGGNSLLRDAVVDVEILRYFILKEHQEIIINQWKQSVREKPLGMSPSDELDWRNFGERNFCDICNTVLNDYKSPQLLGLLLEVFWRNNKEELKEIS